MRITVDVNDVSEKIAGMLRLPSEQVKPDTELAQLITDSFMLVELFIEMQEEYGVCFEQGDVQNIRTVDDVAVLVQQRRAA